MTRLDSRTDDYIKGLIVHELSEMSYPFRMYYGKLGLAQKDEAKSQVDYGEPVDKSHV